MIGRAFTDFTNKLLTMQSAISPVGETTRELRAGQKIVNVSRGIFNTSGQYNSFCSPVFVLTLPVWSW